MFRIKSQKNISKNYIFNMGKKNGFTLIEMLVSIALFSIVITISMGTIFTIIDTNRKAQTLTLVMNNLNFSLESMTRTFKTAVPDTIDNTGTDTVCATDFSGTQICYHWNKNGPIKFIERKEGNGDYVAVTSTNVDITNFSVYVDNVSGTQPKVFFTISGVAQISPRVSSDFDIQTTVTARKLNIQ